jgi:hypothetical protein
MAEYCHKADIPKMKANSKKGKRLKKCLRGSLMSKRIAELFIIMLVAAMSISVGFIAYFINARGDLANGVELASYTPDLSNLAPGNSVQQDVPLKTSAEGTYTVSFDFSKGETDALAPYVDVTLVCGEISLEKSLTELLGKEFFSFEYYLSSDPVNAVITFSVPSTVGNEAQGATADVSISVSINKV